MRGDGLEDGLRLAVLTKELEAELEVGALEVAIDRLADVVEECRARRDLTFRRAKRPSTPTGSRASKRLVRPAWW